MYLNKGNNTQEAMWYSDFTMDKGGKTWNIKQHQELYDKTQVLQLRAAISEKYSVIKIIKLNNFQIINTFTTFFLV